MKKCVVGIFIVILISSMTFASGDRVSLGYIYNSFMSHTEIVNNTNGNINTVSPTCFDLSIDGRLEINDILNQDFVNDMHEREVLVTPFLSNHWGRKRAQIALNNPEILADDVVNAILKYNLDGVNVDLENLLPSDKDKLTNLVKILREKLPEEKILSVAVASNPNKFTTTWIASYDYSALSQYSDYLVLMAYDEHSSGGSEGPVASIGFVEKSIEVILESVSRDKVVLGIPLYGRYWKVGAETGGEAIIASQIEIIAKRYNSVPFYDDSTGTTTITLDIKSGEKKAYVNGKYLDEGIYRVWYENENSIMKKLDVMNKYGLRGAGLWALGNENNDFWKWYSKGFFDDNYESEKSVEQRNFYEYVEVLKSQVKPLKIERKIEIETKKINEKEERFVRTTLEHIKHKHVITPSLEKSKDKVYMKGKYYKKIEKISFNHMVKRYDGSD